MEDLLYGKIIPDFLLNGIYDVFKFFIGFLLVRWLYDGLFKTFLYGGYRLEVWRNDAGNPPQKLTERNMTPAWAEKILKDENERSVYVKGVVSPFARLARLAMDVSSREAQEKGLIKIDKGARIVNVNLSCCDKVLETVEPEMQ